MKKIKKKSLVQIQEPKGINVKQLVFSIKKNKYWFFAFAAIGLALAFLYNMSVPQKYNIVTSLLVKKDNSQATLTSVHPDIQEEKKDDNTVQDQVGVLSSYTLNLLTLNDLKWNVSWTEKHFPVNTDLYKNDPFKLDTLPNAYQVKGIPVEIKQIDNERYNISCNEVQEINGGKHKIQFESTGYFGKQFKNSYFNFILNKFPGQTASDETFILKFNDLGQLAKSYQQELKISPGDDGSDLITIELASRQPERAIDYLSELDKVYIKFGLTEKNRRAANTVKFINNQIAGISDSLQATGNNVSDYRSSNNVIDINQQSSAIVNDLDKLQNDIAAAKMQLEYFTNLKRYVNSASDMKSVVAPSVVGITDASLNALVVKLGDLFHQREVLSYTAQDKSPQMISLDEEITYTQRTIGENLNNLVNNAKVQLENLTRQEANINSAKTAIPKTEQNLNKVKRNFDFNNELYSFLLQKRSEAQIAEASRDPDAQIIDEASFGTATLKGFNHTINLMIGIILGLIIPFLYLLSKAFFKNQLKYIEDVKEQLQPSIVGNILHNKFENELPVIIYPHSEITESFRGLRINLQYLLNDLNNKVISIHSSIAGEGKTFVSSNLAAILAINNKTVLLVDADLRQPRTHALFNCDNSVGLANYLSGELNFNEIIHPTEIKGLSLVVSGPKPNYPSELLGGDRLAMFIAEAKQHYEYIVFNNAPLSIVKDGMMLALHSDANIFLLRMKKSSVAQLAYVNEILVEGVVKNVVVALNNVTSESYGQIGQLDHGYYNDNRMLKLN